MPDSEAIVPLVIGRDLMEKMLIGLFQIKNKVSYSKDNLLKLSEDNKLRILPEATTDALSSFNLMKHPVENKTEAPTNLNSSNLNDLKVYSINFDNHEEMEDIEQVILLIDTEEIKSDFNINTQLSVAQAEALRSIIQDDYVNEIGNRKIRTFTVEIKMIDNKPMHSSP